MFTIVMAVVAVSGISAGLAALLVLAGRYVSNYGECKIRINKEKELVQEGGVSLLDALTSEKIFIPSACGGRGTCGYCKVKVLEGGGPLLPTEEPYLDKKEVADGVRLSCQVKIRNDIEIEIPEELFRVQEFQCNCERIVDLTHDIKEFRFRLSDPPQINYTPGQYMQLLAPEYEDNEEVYRAYSISSDPREKDVIEMVIRLVPNGICTTYCFNYLKPEMEALMNGPYGEFHLSDTEAPMLFIAGGSGMAPIKCILHHMVNENIGREAKYFFGANYVNELFYLDLMADFEQKLPNFKFIPVVANPPEDGSWKGETGLVTQALARHVPDSSQHEAYLCGSPGMIDASIKVLTAQGMPEEKIYYDKFA